MQAIMRPLALKTSKLRVLLTIFLIWGLSSLISLPPIIFSQEFPISRYFVNTFRWLIQLKAVLRSRNRKELHHFVRVGAA
jgi:hypothetical protein